MPPECSWLEWCGGAYRTAPVNACCILQMERTLRTLHKCTLACYISGSLVCAPMPYSYACSIMAALQRACAGGGACKGAGPEKAAGQSRRKWRPEEAAGRGGGKLRPEVSAGTGGRKRRPTERGSFRRFFRGRRSAGFFGSVSWGAGGCFPPIRTSWVGAGGTFLWAGRAAGFEARHAAAGAGGAGAGRQHPAALRQGRLGDEEPPRACADHHQRRGAHGPPPVRPPKRTKPSA